MKVDKQIQRFRVKLELQIKIKELINNFKSEEEVNYKQLTKDDIINVLATIIMDKSKN